MNPCPSTFAAALAEAADTLREEHAMTMQRTPFDVTDTHDAIGYVIAMIDRHGEILDHFATGLRASDGAGYVDDQGGDPNVALCLSHRHIEVALDHLRDVFDHLTAAQNNLGHLGRTETKD